ncbi:MAG: DUF6119 family protein, partial [Culicoidibacterales bacterium]
EDFYGKKSKNFNWKIYKSGTMVSTIALFEVNDSIYAVCTGFGIHKIKSLMQPNLGIEFIKRLDGGTKTIKKQSEVSVDSNNNKLESYYLEPIDLFSVSSFENKVKKEIIAAIDKKQLIKLGIINDSGDTRHQNTTLHLKGSIAINSTLDNITELIQRIKGIDFVLNSNIKQEFPIVNIEETPELVASFTKEILADIRDEKWDKIFLFNSSKLTKIKEFVVKIKKQHDQTLFHDVPTAKDFFTVECIAEKIKNFNTTVFAEDDYQDFFKIFDTITIKTKGENPSYTVQKIENFIHYIFEDSLGGTGIYYYSEGEFYIFETDYIRSIEQEYKRKIDDSIYELDTNIMNKIIEYSGQSEGDYNSLYNDLENAVCLDQKYIDSNKKYEIADFLLVEDEVVYLFHAKVDFGADLRALQKQIEIAERQYRLFEHDKTKMENNFKNLLSLSGVSEEKQDDLLKLILEAKQYCFIGVILGKSKENSINSNSIQGKLAIINLMQKIDVNSPGKIKFLFL